MGFWDNIGGAINSFSSAMERQQEEIERKAAKELRNKTDYQLENLLRRAQQEDNYKLEELVQNELNRRGIY